jgi:hypothetical protein
VRTCLITFGGRRDKPVSFFNHQREAPTATEAEQPQLRRRGLSVFLSSSSDLLICPFSRLRVARVAKMAGISSNNYG